ncbi:MAG: glycosyltransferase family 4 protein [Gemmatimonadaceae bacterium]|nr:glycosyltransferase family 4 protein [Gloeobacterales cyanobacterium ES-bin-141]
MHKLCIVPGSHHSLGGALVTLALLATGFKRCGESGRLCIVVWADSFTEKYLREAGHGDCLQVIKARSELGFAARALGWVTGQSRDIPLLLDNWTKRELMPVIAAAAPILRLSGRPVYHFCHDLGISENLLGKLGRKFAFGCLSPGVLCNSNFTAGYVRTLMADIRGVLYQPVGTVCGNVATAPPVGIEPLLHSGARVMLTPARISAEGAKAPNDKNLRALVAVVERLKAAGHHYHAVIVGQDRSPGQVQTRMLLEKAAHLGVSNRFTILPPTFAIEEYYQYAHVMVTLAPREPFGRTVVEAIACGVPVVGSHSGGIGEILGHFAPEWRVAPEDPAAAAQAIVRIATDPQTPSILARGQTWVATHCSTTAYARQLMEITGLASDARPVRTKRTSPLTVDAP